MADIPVHYLKAGRKLLAFEVMQWRKDVSKINAALPHRHDYYEVLVFLKGGGAHEIDFTGYANKTSSLHFISANQVHQLKREAGSSGFSLWFAQEFFSADFILPELAFYKIKAFPVLDLSAKEFATLVPLMNELKNEYTEGRESNRELMQSLLRAFLLKAQRLYIAKELNQAGQTPGRQNPFTTQFEHLVEQHFQQHWRAGDYAKALSISPARLNALCRQHYSHSTEAAIQNRLLLEIKRLLVYSGKTVKEICYEMNFDDPAYFNRFFKKHVGCTPLEYRESASG